MAFRRLGASRRLFAMIAHTRTRTHVWKTNRKKRLEAPIRLQGGQKGRAEACLIGTAHLSETRP